MDEHVQACIAQKEYCEQNCLPQFAPASGYCYRCGGDLYAYYSVEDAGSKLITGCPFCHTSFCD